MNKIPNRQVACEVLLEAAAQDKNIVVLCSDSRGSAMLSPFAEQFPEQFVEVGIAEQNLVSISAGLAACGKRAFPVSPACFLSTRSMEQARVDVAYSNTNVKLIGISGGVSYGALGMTHHSNQDIATMGSIPNMRVYLPSDRHQMRKLMEVLVKDNAPAYIRIGRNAVPDVYSEDNIPFAMDRATLIRDGKDAAIIACGELTYHAAQAAQALEAEGISLRVLDMFSVKPLDREAVVAAARETGMIFTVEEHGPFGGLGSLVSQVVAAEHPTRVVNLSLPDAPAVTGNSLQVFAHYGLDAEGIAATVRKELRG